MKKSLVFAICSLWMFSCTDSKTAEIKEDAASTAPVVVEPKDYEFADSKFVDMAKKGFDNLQSGNIDAWLNDFADNAIYRWNNFDSLVGKAAIADYWKKRRSEVIDSLTFSSQIWLPIKLNIAQTEGQLTGNYALSWNVVHAKYKNGGSMSQRVHSVIHFDANDKIDRISQYLDHAPILAATKK